MKRSSVILVLLAATFVIDGVIAPSLAPKQESGMAVFHGFLIAIICYCWCKAEAEERGAITPGRSALWAGVFPLIGMPAYFFRTRPKARAIKATAKALALLVLLSLADAGIAEAIRAVRT